MWINFISRVSSAIHNTKEKIIDAGVIKTIGIAFVVVFLELFLLIISLPVYIFITPEKISKDKKEIERYRLKRKVSIISVFAFIALVLVKTVFFGGLFFAGSAPEIRAASVSWGFDNPKEYIYDSSKLQVTDGMVLFNTDESSVIEMQNSYGGGHSQKQEDVYSEENKNTDDKDIQDEEDGVSSTDTISNDASDNNTNSSNENENTSPSDTSSETTPDSVSSPSDSSEDVSTDSKTEDNSNNVIPDVNQPEQNSDDLYSESNSKPTVEEVPDPAQEQSSEPPSEQSTESDTMGIINNLFDIQTAYAAKPAKVKDPVMCKAVIQPSYSMVVPNIVQWTGFTEVANKNDGEIYYQLSDDNGLTWYFWNDAWIAAGADDYNTASIIDKNIKEFPTHNGQILFRAFLISDCKTSMQLIDVTISYNQTKGRSAYWNFDDGQGDVVRDSIHSSDGKISGAEWTQGVSKSGLYFDGKTAYVSFPHTHNIAVSDEFSVSIWAKPSTNTTATIIGKESEESGWSLYQDAFKGWSARVKIDKDTIVQTDWGKGDVITNTWAHLVMIFNKDILKLYVNGEEMSSAIMPGATKKNFNTNNSSIFVGAQTNADGFFYGDIDDVSVYTNILSQEEVSKIYNDYLSLLEEESPDVVMPTEDIVDNSIKTIAILPDTQSSVAWKHKVLTSQTKWLANEAKNMNLAFVGHVGDLVNDETDKKQWSFIQSEMNRLGEAGVSYSVLPGENDYKDGTRISDTFNNYFPLTKFKSMKTFGGSFDDSNDNTYHIVTIGENKLLVLSLEFGPRKAVVEWANKVLQENSNTKAMIITHAYMHPNNELISKGDKRAASNGYGLGHDVMDGVDLWENLVYPNSNISFVLCGHDYSEEEKDGSGLRISEHSDGSPIYQILADYQAFPWDNSGYIVLLQFDIEKKLVHLKTYSPYIDKYKIDKESESDFDFSFQALFSINNNQQGVTITDENGNQIKETDNEAFIYNTDLSSVTQKVAYIEIGSEIDISKWNITSDSSTGTSVVHIGDLDRSALNKIRLIVPKLPEHTFVRVCPGASLADEVVEGCDGEIHLSKESPYLNGYSLVMLDDPNYWYVEPDDVSVFSTGAQGGISHLGSSVAFDSSAGIEPDLVKIDRGVFAVAYTGPGTDGFVRTIKVDDEGNILDTRVDTLEFDTVQATNVKMIRISDKIYAITYSGSGSDGYIATVGIDSEGSISDTIIDVLEFDTSNGLEPSIVRVSDGVYAIAYRGVSNDGFIKTIKIDVDGNIGDTVFDTLEFDIADCVRPHIIKLTDSEDIYAIAYQGTSGDGFVKTVRIKPDGDIDVAIIDSWEFDIADCMEPFIAGINKDVYAITYGSVGSDGFIKTITISPEGAITRSAIDTLEYDTLNGRQPFFSSIVDSVYASIYQGDGNDGFIKTVTINTDGAIDDRVISTMEFDTVYAAYPKSALISRDVYLLAYQGNGSIGYLNTVHIENTPSSIAVTYPNGGERVAVGSTARIQWTSVNTSGNVKIEYSKDNFVADLHVVVASTADDGSYDWVVPSDVSSTVKIRITDITVSTITDISDNNFSITDAISRWTFNEGSGCTAVDASDSNNGTLSPSCPSNGPTWTSGKFSGALSFGGDDKVVVSDANNLDITTQGSLVAWVKINTYRDYAGIMHKGSLSDFSDEAWFLQFGGPGYGNNKKIIAGGHGATGNKYLLSNTELNLGTWYQVVYTWNSSGQKLYINNTLDTSSTDVLVARVTNGSLQIGSQLSNNYYLNGVIDDVSVYNYALSSAQINTLYGSSVEVLYPNGGESLEIGSTETIRWTSVNTSGNVKIEYSKDNFVADVHTVIASTPDDRSYDWIIPPDVSTTAKIRITDVLDGTITDISYADFTITPPPSISVTYPNGNTSVFIDSFANIKWTSVNTSGNVKIEYSKDDFVADVHTIIASTPDDGDFAWLIPNDSSTTVKIKISDTTEPIVNDTSDSSFSIAESNVNPISFWPFDNGSGCTATDIYGSHNGSLLPSCSANSPLWINGKENTALDFDGADDYVNIDNSSDLNPTTAITLSAWVRWDIDPTTGNQWASIINKNNDNQYRLHHNQTNSAFEFALRTSTGNKWIQSTVSPSESVWYFIVGTYDGSVMKLYINGALDTSSSWNGYITGSSGPLNIGRRAIGNDRYFNGAIDEVGIWNRVLTPTEINTMYLEGNNTNSEIVINSISQQNNDGFVNINYTITDQESNFVDLISYEYSLTGDFTGEEKTMTEALGDIDHDGVSSLSSSPGGNDHVFVWDVLSDIPDLYDNTVYVRLRPSDGIEDGNFITSNVFSIDTKKPALSNFSAEQRIGSNMFDIHYDLSDDTSTQIVVNIDISDDGGATWDVISTTSTGDIGSGIESGIDKTISWNAGVDFDERDGNDMMVRIYAMDNYQNGSDYVYTDVFSLDTKNPFGLNNFSGVSSDSTSIIWSWDPVSIESNFNHYEIWYGQNVSDVQNRNGGARKWSNTNDNDLNLIGTASTRILGLVQKSTYYAKIWAVDDFGNETSVSESSFATLSSAGSESSSTQTGGGGGSTFLIINNTPPFTPILDQPGESSSGSVNISGTAEPNSYIDVYVDGNLYGNKLMITQSNGSFSGNILLGEGEHDISIIATDGRGNASVLSSLRRVRVGLSDKQSENNTEFTGEGSSDTEYQELVDAMDKVSSGLESVSVIKETQQQIDEAFIEKEKIVMRDVSYAQESVVLQVPRVLQVTDTSIGNTIRFRGKGVPNSDVVLFIYSEQALVYKTRVDSNGDWALHHSQNEIELEEGKHEVYALTMDTISKIKSKTSKVVEFTVTKNRLATILSYFDVPTTLLTIVVALIGIGVFFVGRRRHLNV